MIAPSEEDLQTLVDCHVKENEAVGLGLNTKKIKCMVMSKKKNIPNCKIAVHGEAINQFKRFRYLGSLVSEDGKPSEEIKSKIGRSKQAFNSMKSVSCNLKLRMDTRLSVPHSHIWPMLLYVAEAWTLRKVDLKKLEAAEMWFIKRMLKVPWTAKKSNSEVFEIANYM